MAVAGKSRHAGWRDHYNELSFRRRDFNAQKLNWRISPPEQQALAYPVPRRKLGCKSSTQLRLITLLGESIQHRVKSKQKKHPVRYATAMRLERTVYGNAARLFLDACTLYANGSFPSAYSLAILAFEEIGKVQMMDHVCFEAVLNDGSFRLTADRMEHLFSREMFYSHRNKQAWGIYRGSSAQRKSQVESLIDERSTLDRHKQDALYVGFSSGRIQSPERFHASHAYRQLRYVVGAFVDLSDLPFYGVFEESTHATRREAERTCAIIKKAFKSLPSPRKRKPNKRPERNAGAASVSTSMPSSGVAHP